jgi:hypothetical protein
MNTEDKISELEYRLKLRSNIMFELMNAVEHYQKRSHEIERISLELLTCPWWKITKIIRLEKRIHLAILSHMEDTSIDKTFSNLKDLAKGHLDEINGK